MSRVLIIIPCLNEEAYLEALVEKLVKDTALLDAHIVIADGMSTDRTPDLGKALAAKHINVSYLQNPKRLQSAAVNLAVATYGTDAEYLIRIDAHADYPDDFCTILLEEAEVTGAQSVVVPMDTVGTSGFQKAVAAAQNSKLGNGGSAHRVAGETGKWIDHGHHALMQVTSFQTVGGYDDSFSHNEDAELDIRLTRTGYKIWLTGKTGLTYYPRNAMRPLFRQYYKFGEGRARTIFKHKIKPRIRQMVPLVVAPALVFFLLSPLWSILALPLLGWAGICLFYGALLAFKAKDPDLLSSGIAIMIMHAAWSIGFWGFMIRHMMRGST